MIIASIIGIDPGTNTGIAILDLHGNLISLSSERNVGRGGIIRSVTRYSKPLIIAVDVNPAPSNVERLASSMGTLLFTPGSTMSVKEKNALIKEYKRNYKREEGEVLKIHDKHERDALAAALKALKSNSYLLRKLDNVLERKDLEHIFDEVFEELIMDKSENITNAIRKVMKRLEKRQKRRKSYAKNKKL